jgi:hypothetical protein
VRVVAFMLVLMASNVEAQDLRIDRRVAVTLAQGIARVHETLTITGPRGQEAAIDEALPSGAGLASLRVCRAGACRVGRDVDIFDHTFDGPAPAATVTQRDGRLAIRAYPLDPHAPLRVEVRYVATASLSEGRIGVVLPAYTQGTTRVELRAPGLTDLRTEGEPARGVRLSARMRDRSTSIAVLAARCGHDRCLRYRAAAGPARRRARDVYLFIDASPSVDEVIDPSRRADAIRVLLDALAPGSTVTRVAFAWRAMRLDARARSPHEIDASDTIPTDLGPATRIANAWALVERDIASARDPLVVVLGDGTHGRWPAEQRALDAMAAANVEVTAIDLVGRRLDAPLARAIAATRGIEIAADRAPDAASLAAEPIIGPEIRIGDRVLGELRANQELVYETRSAAAAPLFAGATRVGVRTLAGPWAAGMRVRASSIDARRDRGTSLTAISRSELRRALAARPRYRVPHIRVGQVQVMGAVSRESFARVRAQLRPRVRECFRRARRGHLTRAMRVELNVVISQGEIVFAQGAADDTILASCVGETPAILGRIPSADRPRDYPDVVSVHFVFASEPEVEPPPPAIPIAADIAAMIDEIEAR